jgi:hypothetical protein
MSELSVTIPKAPALKPAEDYYLLRRKGIGFIEEMGSRHWTDYNTHDPGITILEALCYAITDLAYRVGWDIRDILAPQTPSADPTQPYPNQAFFTARQILTVNPTTPDDFRRLLIDLDLVRNAWLFCKECACDLVYYAWCENEKLRLSHHPRPNDTRQQQVWARGLYDVLLELESAPDLGDLNDRKIVSRFTIHDSDGPHATTMELRFPQIEVLDREGWELFLDTDAAFASPGTGIDVTLTQFGATRDYDLFSDPTLDQQGRDDYLRRHWNDLFFLDLEVALIAEAKIIRFKNVTLRLYGDSKARRAATADALKGILQEKASGSIIQRYRNKALLQFEAVERAKGSLQAHRNLDEDYCHVAVVGIEEIAACADVEVRPDADIERVQAQIWFEIEQYLNPPVPFYTLQELMAEEIPVEEIFNGPELESGFIKAEDLEKASLKTVLRVSDIINRLMDIDGVVAVNHLQLAKYDSEGNLVKGAADPTWSSEGHPIFDPNKESASWLMYLAPQHQPRLYLNASRFTFYKSGLPFLPRMDEAADTLTQLRGEAERPKIKNAMKDLPIPAGSFRNPEDYFPVQYSLPMTYGIGKPGLPAHVPAKRRAQAKQLKAYLLVFEQLLGNALAQVAHAADLFSLDPLVDRTYFVRMFNEAAIAGYGDIAGTLTQTALEEMTETLPEFLERRNRFLDHLLARFGEQFVEYALLLTNLEGQQVALDQLIDDKISFLKGYPLVSHDRGRAFDYTVDPCGAGNFAGLKKRVELLLGLQNERAIVVEHLLLRPKFPGDALYPACACSETGCRTCGDEDPYSFKMTFVMPGWLKPFDSSMEMRSFADRTIQEETPSHLVCKICWVGNDGFGDEPEAAVVVELADLLMEKGVTSGGTRPLRADACDCATALYTAFNGAFKAWFQDKTLLFFTPDTLRAELGAQFAANVEPTDFTCTTVLEPALWVEIQALMVEHFVEVALHGWQFERFEDAWCKWLEANALIDWTREHMQERLEAVLTANLLPTTATQTLPSDAMCRCAAELLALHGSEFYDFILAAFQAGLAFEDIPEFVPSEVALCPGFEYQSGTDLLIHDLLQERYNAYKEVSYRLWMVVHLLSRLRNSYPPATLHDFDAGDDENPVRLGKTALGS